MLLSAGIRTMAAVITCLAWGRPRRPVGALATMQRAEWRAARRMPPGPPDQAGAAAWKRGQCRPLLAPLPLWSPADPAHLCAM